jgi:hypothetical protein
MKLKLTVAVALLVAGCTNIETIPREKPTPSEIIFAGNDDLGTQVAVDLITRTPDPAGLLHVVIPVK